MTILLVSLLNIHTYYNLIILKTFLPSYERTPSTHLALTENRLKFFDRMDPTNIYENTYIWWYETIKINWFCQTLFEKTHLGTNDLAKIKPRSKKYPLCFWKSRVILGQKSVFNHSYWCQKGKKRLLACLLVPTNDNNWVIVNYRPKH